MDWRNLENKNRSRKKFSKEKTFYGNVKILGFEQPPPDYASYVGDSNNIDGDGTDLDDERLCSKEAIKKNVKYYLQNTTLHGLKYIAEDKITIPERVFFGLSFVLVVILSGFFISNVYEKWSASPIIISTSAKQTPATSVPFPAITICNLNQASKNKVHNLSSDKGYLLSSLCDQPSNDIFIQYRGLWKFFKALLVEVAQPCSEMLLYCSFGTLQENCSILFNTVLTDDGLCCTFNALDPLFLLKNYSEESLILPAVENHYTAIDWTPENGYPSELPDHFYPRVSGGTGSRMGLTVILNVSSAEYYCAKTKCVGFKVLVHNPAEQPKISNYGFLMTAGREARIPIEPVYQNAEKSIRSIKIPIRKCLFSDEGDLVYYRTYSRKNCELECESKILMKKCSCVLYYLPRIDPTVAICGPKDNLCTNEVQSQIESSNSSVSCDSCLPGCFELNYQTVLTASQMVHGNFNSFDGFPVGIFNCSDKLSDLAVMHFYFTSNMIRCTTKSEMFGFTEFLSNTGGLLGLFMGFSVFSVIEIIFYVTIRPYCAARSMELERRRKHKEIKWLKNQHYKGDQLWKQKSWFKKFKKSSRTYKSNLKNMFKNPGQIIAGNDNTIQVFPYTE